MNNILMFSTTFLIQIIIAIEMGVIGPLAPFLAKHFSINEGMVMLFNLGYSAVGFLVPYLGVFADKYGKKKSLVISLILFIIGSTIGGFARSSYIFAFARIFIGFAYFSISGTNLSYISEFISYENRGKASGLLRTAFGSAILFSPIYATYLVSKYNNLAIIYIPLAIVGTLSLILLINLPETKKSHDVKVDKKEFLSLLKNPIAKKMLLTVFLLLTAPSLILNYLSIYLSNNFNLSQVNIGIAYTFIALGTIAGILFSAIFSDKLGKYKLSKGLFVLMVLAIIPITYFNSLPLVLSFVTLFSFGLDGGWTSYQALASEIIPEKRGTFMSLFYTVNALTITFYSIIGPLIYTLGGFKLVLSIAAISSILAIIIISKLDIKE
ncbi:MFS transporter [Tissierella carlieri]|uniref:MFS transporter n=1 Tax=Tissierella carlieri TaxID=689904 RepID=A0ABT1SCP6_9FIRM|nr:MFS transporter [Tissierella carlieri]MBU5310553.1 MFS transporter [Tissierella carlieri]MCQ4924230.1 MFS transporter [Tissierella carlieri]